MVALKKTGLNIYAIFCVAALVLLSVNPSYTEGNDGINLLLCSALCLSPLLLLLKGNLILLPRIDIPLSLVSIFTVIFPLAFNPDTMRWSTMLFTCAYCVFFMVFARLVRNADIKPELFLKTLSWIVYAYTIVLIIQQICVLSGFPIPFKSIYYYDVIPFKLNSLSAEASHTTIFLSICMYFYMQTRVLIQKNLSLIQDWKDNPLLWLAYSWTIFSTFNTSAFVFFPLSLLPFVNKKNLWGVAGAFTLLFIILILSPKALYRHSERLIKVGTAVLTLNEEKILEADKSAAFRILPTIRGVKTIKPDDIRILTGYGVDADKSDTAPRPLYKDHPDWGSAGIFSMWHNFGCLCAISLWIAIFFVTIIKNRWLTYLTFLLGIMMSADYNMQMVWQLMAFSLIYKYSIAGYKNLLDK